MPQVLAWALVALGVAHLGFGVIRYRRPLKAAVAGGFLGQFALAEDRRTAFWFLMCGPLLMLIGHLAVRAVAQGQTETLTLVGLYALPAAVLGVAAFPRSPLWVLLLLSLLLLAAGQGVLGA